MSKSSKTFVSGHLGMVGSAIIRRLEVLEYQDVVTASRDELDLRDAKAVQEFFHVHRPEQVYIAAARVGGISANSARPADFIWDNLMIEANLIKAAHDNDVQRLLFLGSSCIYPKFAEQPIREDRLLTGTLEPTNEPYAIAKIAGNKLCESFHRQFGRDYRSVMPTNLYGPGDNFHREDAHVVPALLRRFHEAVQANASAVTIWGSGDPRREFLHVDDMAAASVHVMELGPQAYWPAVSPMMSHINVGSGDDCTIAELAQLVADVTGFKGKIEFDRSKPDGSPRKLLDVSLLHSLCWSHAISLPAGLNDTYVWFLDHQAHFRGR